MVESLPPAPRDRREALAAFAQHPAAMRDILQRLLHDDSGAPCRILECRAGPLRRGDGYRHAVQYDLQLRDEMTGRIWQETVTGVSYGKRRTRRIWNSLPAERLASQAAPIGSPFPPFAYFPELDMLVQTFPHDHRLPSLATLLAGPPPPLAASLLSRLGGSDWRIERWDATSIRYRVDSRATLRVAVAARAAGSDRTDERVVFVKIYRDAAEAQDAHEMLAALHDRAIAAGARFSVPAPVAVSAGLCALVQEEAKGRTLLSMLRSGEDAIPAARLAARAIADLHQLDLGLVLEPAGPETPRSLPNRLARLREASALMRSARPDLAPQLAEIETTATQGLAATPTTPIHGDLKPDHVLLDGDHVSLLDFDFLHAGDPMLDVANIESHLIRANAQASDASTATETASQVFIDEYFAHAPDARPRLRLYRAMNLLGEAARSRHRADPRWQDRLDDVVRQAQAALSAGGD